MKNLLNSLVGKKITIHMIDESLNDSYTLESISENAISCVDNTGCTVIANLEYITGIEEVREVPKKKKEKKERI